jgi:transposase-like protein
VLKCVKNRGLKMSVKQKTYATEFKARVALDAIKGELTINQITSKHGIHSTQVSRWKQQALNAVKQSFSSKRDALQKNDQELTEQLYKQIGQMKVELDFLKKSVWE